MRVAAIETMVVRIAFVGYPGELARTQEAREGPGADPDRDRHRERLAHARDGHERGLLAPRIEDAGHTVAAYRLLKDEPDEVEAALDELAEGEARLILLNGGTGISPRDTTFDAVSRKLEKTLPGFGELFRMLSYEQVGAAAMLSRATAGVYRETVVISTPGSPAAVALAWEKLIAPELEHLAWEVVR